MSAPLQWKQGRSAYYIEADDYTVARTHDVQGARYHAWYAPREVRPRPHPICLSPGPGHASAAAAKADAQAHADQQAGASS